MPDPKTDIMERIAGFGNPVLFRLLSGKIDLHVDALFYIILKQFHQILAIMAYDPQTRSCVLYIYALITGKCIYFN